jgi:hypothetical protein
MLASPARPTRRLTQSLRIETGQAPYKQSEDPGIVEKGASRSGLRVLVIIIEVAPWCGKVFTNSAPRLLALY